MKMEEEFDFADLDEGMYYVPSLSKDSSSGEGEDPEPSCPQTHVPNLRRKSHRKSRGGCFNCKSRKIKVSDFSPGYISLL